MVVRHSTMNSDREKRKSDQINVSMEQLVFAILLSGGLLVYGTFGLAKNDVVLPTRVGMQHFHGTEALVFYAFLLVALISNCMRLYAWRKYNGEINEMYKIWNSVSLFALFGFIGYSMIS